MNHRPSRRDFVRLCLRLKEKGEFSDELNTEMDINPEIIVIGEVRCSFGFEDGFFEKKFGAVLGDYRRWGFCARGEPKIFERDGTTVIFQKGDSGAYASMIAAECVGIPYVPSRYTLSTRPSLPCCLV